MIPEIFGIEHGEASMRASLIAVSLLFHFTLNAEGEGVFKHTLTPVSQPRQILSDYPRYVEPVVESKRYRVPTLIDDGDANLAVDSWRFSYNARGIIEVPNRLNGSKVAIIVVHPWGIDDGQGWRTPEPAGVAFGCTPEKNKLMLEHARDVVNPFLQKWRKEVGLVVYSLPGKRDQIRGKMYRSVGHMPTEAERATGKQELSAKLNSFKYEGESIPAEIPLASKHPAIDYFKALPGLEAYQKMNPKGFWDLPIPVMKPIDVDPNDVVIYDGEGYEVLRSFLIGQGIEHVLLCGYHADMCVCSTTAGYEKLRNDFNVFLVGDAVQASLPANVTAKFSTNHAVATASLKILVTQVSWITAIERSATAKGEK